MLQLTRLNIGSHSSDHAVNHAEWLVEENYSFGTGSQNTYIVSGDAVSERQARLSVKPEQVVLHNVAGGQSVYLNGKPLKQRATLKSGDHFSVGEARFKIEDPKLTRTPAKTKSKAKTLKRNWQLKGCNTAIANKIIPLKGRLSIGRSQECDICLNVMHLSRQHARITVTADRVLLEDLNSANGTFVNGQRIKQQQLQHGDEVAFDTLRFFVEGPEQAAEVRPQAVDNKTQLRPSITQEEIDALKANKRKKQVKKNNPDLEPKNPPIDPELKQQIEQLQYEQDQIQKQNNSQRILIGLLLACIAIGIWLFFGF
ncbi:FHA domain-containing protein [Agaribacterium sp. ZY112]|uniref:FHA domain-containing protein n=1 Tax=Agaribacterium sp. ZY112 TaxID=3233574 RepID=UPI003526437A